MRTSKKIFAILLAILMVLSTIPMSVFAVTPGGTATISGTSDWLNNYKYAFSGYTFPDGTHTGAHGTYQNLKADGQVAYCVEPGKSLSAGIKDVSAAWGGLTANQRALITAAFIYGYNGTTQWANADTEYVATQVLIWAIVKGVFNTANESAYFEYAFKGTGPTAKQTAITVYGYIKDQIVTHRTVPSFDGQTVTLRYNSSTGKYEGSITDTNGVLSGYTYSYSGITFTKNGNTLKISSPSYFSSTYSVLGKRTSNTHKTSLPMISACYLTGSDQTTATAMNREDPVNTTIKLKAEGLGSAQIVKISEKSGEAMNVKFKITGPNNYSKEVVTNVKTNDNTAYVLVDNLVPGTYTVTEVSPKSYYFVDPAATQTVTVTPNGTGVVKFGNWYKKGTLEVKKVSSDNGKLDGWTFEVTGTSDSGETVNFTMTTDANGVAKRDHLLIGNYTIRETNCPSYMVVPSAQSVRVNYSEIASANFSNVYKKGNLVISKVDSETGDPIVASDAVFAAYSWDKNAGDYSDMPTYFTYSQLDAATYGTLGFTEGYVVNNLPITETNDGKYKVVELTAPTGYLSDDDYYEVQITDNNQTIVVNDTTITNRPQKGQITIHKTDSENGSDIKNALYEVTAKEAIVYNGTTLYNAGDTVATLTTDDSGSAYLEVYLGSYNIKEVSAPYGYIKDNNVYEAILTYDAQSVFVESRVDLTDDVQKGKITLNKHDSETGRLILASAKYNVFADENIYVNGVLTVNKDELVGTITTTDGVGSIENLYLGTYRLEEDTAPRGYLKNDTNIKVTIAYAGENVRVSTESVNDYDAPQYGKITVTKRNDNNQIIDTITASFNVYADADIYVNGVLVYRKGKLVETIYTVDGIAKTGNIPLGQYKVIENTAPFGYVKSTQGFGVNLKYDASVELVEANIAFVNKAQKGTITILKYDSETGNVVAGSEFKITAAEDIYENGDKIYSKNQTVETLVTNEQGKATSSLLPLGSYTVKETKAPKPYVRDKGVYDAVLSYQGQNVSVFNYPVQVTNTPQKGVIELMKVDSETNKPLANAVFEIYAAEAIEVNGYGYYLANDLVDTITTGSDGKATSSNLYVGKYRVVEKTAPTGYVLSPDVHNIEIEYIGQEVDIHTVSFTAENAPQLANIEIVKTDRETNLPLANAVYEIYAAEDVILNGDVKYANGTLIDTVTTNAEGKAQSKLLYLGKYTVKEKTAPHGYVLNADEIPVSLEYKGQNVSTFIETVNTDDIAQKGKLSVYKYGEVFSTVDYTDGYYQPVYEVKPLKNAVYDIFADEDIYTGDGTLRYAKDTLVDTVTTGENGVGESDELYLGKYRVVENTAPDKMVNNPSPNFVELVYGDQNVEVVTNETSFTNDRQTATFVLDKILEKDDVFDDIGGNGEIENIFFGLYAAEDLVADDGTVIPADGIIEIARCDEEGRVIFDTDVPVGKYYTQEIATDEHYLISDTKYELNYQYAGQYILTVEIKANDGDPIVNSLIRGNILGKKINDDGNPVQGALMGLFRVTEIDCSELTALKLAETDENGEFLFEDVPYGDYIVKELKAPTGYVLNEAATPVSVKENDVTVEIEVLNSIIKGTVTTTKVDAEYPDNKLIGAKFEIYADSNANEEFDADIDTLIGVMTDNGDGTYTMSDLRYNGYFMKEVEAPYGFLVDENYYYFEIRNEGEVITVENESGKGCFVDKPGTGELEITKVDIADGKLIPNAGFRIRDLDGNIIVEGRTDENGIAKFKLRIGKYTYEEFDAPAGYILDNAKYPFEIKEHGEIVKALATNEKFVPIPKTGDSLRFAVPCLFALAAASLVGITATTYAKKKRKKSEIDE